MSRENPIHTLLISPNWLGDVVMALPAYRAWRDSRANGQHITVLAKPAVVPLWGLCSGIERVVTLQRGLQGTREAIAQLRMLDCDEAIILPNSFRSAWIAARAAIARRRGVACQWRTLLLNERLSLRGLEQQHQAYENFRIFGVAASEPLKMPPLMLPTDEIAAARAMAAMESHERYLMLLPGAARGTSKRWPTQHFVATARGVVERFPDLRLLICGAPSERPICGEVAAAIGPAARDLSGATSLTRLAALMSQCHAVCCNDSGGMHLAAALSIATVAIFGLTDPTKTGPLGARQRVIAPSGVRPARRIARRSRAAARALASIAPARAVEALSEVLGA